MDKDLHDRLQWLEEELLEADLPEGDQKFDLDDILNEFSQEEQPAAPARNRAVEFDRMAFGDEAFDESTAVRVTRKKEKTTKRKKDGKDEPKKGIKGLTILAILEVVAILLVLLRWALWFL